MKTKSLLLGLLLSIGMVTTALAQDAGSCDITFRTSKIDGNGYALNDVKQIEILADGKILALNGNKITRLHINGMIDTSFHEISSISQTGSSSSEIRRMAIQSDGKIIVGGNFDRFVYVSGSGIYVNKNIARLNPNGAVDTSFHTSLLGNIIDNVMLTSNNKILYSLYCANKIVRLNSNGSLDSTFNSAYFPTYDCRIVFDLQSNGKIIRKKYTSYNGNDNYDLIRLNTDGSLDPTFQFDTSGIGIAIQHLSPFSCIHVQSDDKILIGGAIISFNGVPKNSILRFNADGSIDNSFQSNTSLYQGTVDVIKTQSDGKILIMSGGGGPNGSNAYNGNLNKRYFTRLNSDGTLDSSFVPPSNNPTYNYNNVTTANGGVVSTIAIQNDGKILVGGSFPDYIYGNFGFYFNGTYVPQTIPRAKIARVHNMGVSTSIQESVKENNNISVFPNPTKDYVTISYGNHTTLKGYTLKITNSLGATVFNTSITQNTNSIDLNGWTANGIYFIHLIDSQSNTIDIKKLVIQ